jgi:hypothetical protein
LGEEEEGGVADLLNTSSGLGGARDGGAMRRPWRPSSVAIGSSRESEPERKKRKWPARVSSAAAAGFL